MVGLLGCGCCGVNPPPNCRCFPVWWDDPDFAEYRASADYSWSYNQCENEYNRIIPGLNYSSTVTNKCLHVRDGRFFKWKKGQFQQEIAPHPSAGQWFDKEYRNFLGYTIGPACVLKTSNIDLRTHNLLWETDTHISERAATSSVDFFINDPWSVFVPGDKFTFGCTQKIYPDYSFIGRGYRFWHGIMIRQSFNSLFGSNATFSPPIGLFYVIWTDGGNIFEDGWSDNIRIILKKNIPWGQNRIGVGLSIPDGYPEPTGAGAGIPLFFRFYLNGVQQYSFELENGAEVDSDAYLSVCPSVNGSDWAIRGCIAHVSDWWRPRWNAFAPFEPKVYHSQNPEDALAFDDVAFTKHLKPAMRP